MLTKSNCFILKQEDEIKGLFGFVPTPAIILRYADVDSEVCAIAKERLPNLYKKYKEGFVSFYELANKVAETLTEKDIRMIMTLFGISIEKTAIYNLV